MAKRNSLLSSLSERFRPVYRQFFWILVADTIMLGYLGSRPAEGIYVTLAFLGTLYYYVHFLIILPLLGLLETPKPMPASISEAVLAKKRPSEPGQKLQAAQ